MLDARFSGVAILQRVQRNSSASELNFAGASTCGVTNYRMINAPPFVHDCHGTGCPRDSGAAASLTRANLNGHHAGQGGNGQGD